jgi:antirestriction protein ArdC
MADFRTPARDHYADITNRIIASLEAGTAPWRRPWDPSKVPSGGPRNGVSGHRYRGINTLLLGMTPEMFASGDPRWLSYKQATEKGWQVRKGEKATTIFFFKKVELRGDGRADDGEETRTVPVLRSYPVFHASQVDGIPADVPSTITEAPWRTPESASVVVACSGVVLREGGDRAFYSPSADHVQMPPRVAFKSPEGWASTILHELGHWSGHPSRLDRNLTGRFGTQAYAMEELRAELASAFIGNELGIPAGIDNHASYLSSWLDVLRKDKREIFRASADAQRIADYLLGFHPLYANAMTKESTATDEPAPAPAPIHIPIGPMPAHVRRSLGLDPKPVVVEEPAPVAVMGYRR